MWSEALVVVGVAIGWEAATQFCTHKKGQGGALHHPGLYVPVD
jgi:hypothetical protein